MLDIALGEWLIFNSTLMWLIDIKLNMSVTEIESIVIVINVQFNSRVTDYLVVSMSQIFYCGSFTNREKWDTLTYVKLVLHFRKNSARIYKTNVKLQTVR